MRLFFPSPKAWGRVSMESSEVGCPQAPDVYIALACSAGDTWASFQLPQASGLTLQILKEMKGEVFILQPSWAASCLRPELPSHVSSKLLPFPHPSTQGLLTVSSVFLSLVLPSWIWEEGGEEPVDLQGPPLGWNWNLSRERTFDKFD